MNKKIVLIADHRGFKLKEVLKVKLLKLHLKWDIIDLSSIYKKNDDYPLLVKKAVRVMKKGDRGIFICGSGVGVCVAANRYKNIRAVNGHSVFEVDLARRDEDVNVLCLAGNDLSSRKACKMIDVFLNSSFKDIERYQRRLKQLKRIG